MRQLTEQKKGIAMSKNPFKIYNDKPTTVDGIYSQAEVGLANRNSGILLETLALDITPTGGTIYSIILMCLCWIA